MNGINVGRVIVGGLLAGLVLSLCELVIGAFTGDYWQGVMEQLAIPDPGAAQAIGVFGIDFLYGIALIWIYAAMRPRFGAGAGTAVIAGVAVWTVAWLLSHLSFIVLGLFPTPLMLIEIVGGAVKLVLATLAGAWLYRETRSAARA
jgi:hypothetical protein